MSSLELSAEKELIDRACKGSVDAFEALVLHYQDRLYRFLLVRAGNRADAEDALQDAFVAAFKYLPSYRAKYRFSTWLFTIAVRQLGTINNKRLPPHVDLPESMECGQPGPEQLGIQTQRNQSLWQVARQCLNESQFIALWLFYVEDMPLLDIAKSMKRPGSWVNVNLMRSRRRLLKELDHELFENIVAIREVTL
jgi:RNA polymerase sigma-70 factor (ECF subfamily)